MHYTEVLAKAAEKGNLSHDSLVHALATVEAWDNTTPEDRSGLLTEAWKSAKAEPFFTALRALLAASAMLEGEQAGSAFIATEGIYEVRVQVRVRSEDL